MRGALKEEFSYSEFRSQIELLNMWLKRYSMAVGGVLLAIAITGCNTSSKSIASSPTVPPTSPTQSAAHTESPQQEAVQVIREYYNAIDRRDYKQAYLTWEGDGAASQHSFEQFKQGFANTASVAVEVGKPGRLDAAAGSVYIEIPVIVTAVTTNGTPQRFHGSYILRRVNDVPGSTLEQQRWHLHSANIAHAQFN